MGSPESESYAAKRSRCRWDHHTRIRLGVALMLPFHAGRRHNQNDPGEGEKRINFGERLGYRTTVMTPYPASGTNQRLPTICGICLPKCWVTVEKRRYRTVRPAIPIGRVNAAQSAKGHYTTAIAQLLPRAESINNNPTTVSVRTNRQRHNSQW